MMPAKFELYFTLTRVFLRYRRVAVLKLLNKERVYLDLIFGWLLRVEGDSVTLTKFSFGLTDKSSVCLSLGIGLKALGESHIMVIIIRLQEKARNSFFCMLGFLAQYY